MSTPEPEDPEARARRIAGEVGWASALRPRRSSTATYLLMGVVTVVYLLQWLTGQALTRAWVLDPTVIGVEPWRMLTSTFLHSPATIAHILFNLYALYIFGPPLEVFLGRVRYLALYVVGALGGSLGVVTIYELFLVTGGASASWLGDILAPHSALGASGAIFALMGAYLPMRKAIGVAVPQLLIVIGLNVAIGFLASGIAWEAHLGGLATGVLIGWIFMRTRRRDQRLAQLIGVAAVAVGILALVGAFAWTAPRFYGW